MSSSEFVLCKWHSRIWPAKVLSASHPNSKDALLTVEILCLEERIDVKTKDTKPFNKTKIEAIADKLVKGKEADSPNAAIADLTYRKALRIALEILNSTSGISPGINILKGCKEAPCNNVVLASTEITKDEKQESKTTCVQNKTPVKKNCKPSTPKNQGKPSTPKNQGKPSTPKNQGKPSTPKNQEKPSTPKNQEKPSTPKNQGKPSTPNTNTRRSKNSTEDLITGNQPTNSQTPTKRRTIDSNTNKDGDTGIGEKEPTPCTAGNLDIPGVKRRSRAANKVNQDSLSVNKPSKTQTVEGESSLNEPEVKETEEVKQDQPIIQWSHEEKPLRKEICKATEVNSKSQTNLNTGLKPAKRFKRLHMPEFEDVKGLTSPELSVEFSSSEDCIPAPAWSTEDTEEDEDLPSVLHGQCQGRNSIDPGMFVWYKHLRFPYWPSVVRNS
uniref:PWWP domain-containing protein n=1 Tax=Leptobrachium leishanense TaxID=445787 RepID=A0A8C5LQB1_9ANUR